MYAIGHIAIKIQRKIKLNKWRRKNPDKRRDQNKRAKEKLRQKELHRLYSTGWRPPITDPGKISKCCDCGNDVVSQKGCNSRIYCDTCNIKRQQKKQKEHSDKFRAKHPDYYKIWVQNNEEVLVASTCVTCGNFILYKGRGRIPHFCGYCISIKRSQPYKRWEPKDAETFIKIERKRIGLDSGKKWTKNEINRLFAQYYD